MYHATQAHFLSENHVIPYFFIRLGTIYTTCIFTPYGLPVTNSPILTAAAFYLLLICFLYLHHPCFRCQFLPANHKVDWWCENGERKWCHHHVGGEQDGPCRQEVICSSHPPLCNRALSIKVILMKSLIVTAGPSILSSSALPEAALNHSKLSLAPLWISTLWLFYFTVDFLLLDGNYLVFNRSSLYVKS